MMCRKLKVFVISNWRTCLPSVALGTQGFEEKRKNLFAEDQPPPKCRDKSIIALTCAISFSYSVKEEMSTIGLG